MEDGPESFGPASVSKNPYKKSIFLRPREGK